MIFAQASFLYEEKLFTLRRGLYVIRATFFRI